MGAEIEVTPAMISAGSEALLKDSFLDLSPSVAEHLAEAVLRAALELAHQRTG